MKTTWLAAPFIVLAIVVLTGGGVAGQLANAADTPAPVPAPLPVAHSALLTINATPTEGGLALHVLHAGNQIPIDGRDVTVLVDGKDQPLTVAPEGTFLMSTKDLGSDEVRTLDITVAHDGIREILTGKIKLPKVGSAADLWRDHKQIAWWVLNIAIVGVAVLAFSRKKPEKEHAEEKEEE